LGLTSPRPVARLYGSNGTSWQPRWVETPAGPCPTTLELADAIKQERERVEVAPSVTATIVAETPVYSAGGSDLAPFRVVTMTPLDREGRQLLHYAAMANDPAKVAERLAAGDDANLGDRMGMTPLHLACQEGATAAASLLLDAGANVDQPNKHGNTPLFVAVFNSRGRGDVIRLLRSRGANPLYVNKAGQTPLGLAQTIGNYDVAQFFSDIAGIE